METIIYVIIALLCKTRKFNKFNHKEIYIYEMKPAITFYI